MGHPPGASLLMRDTPHWLFDQRNPLLAGRAIAHLCARALLDIIEPSPARAHIPTLARRVAIHQRVIWYRTSYDRTRADHSEPANGDTGQNDGTGPDRCA